MRCLRVTARRRVVITVVDAEEVPGAGEVVAVGVEQEPLARRPRVHQPLAVHRAAKHKWGIVYWFE